MIRLVPRATSPWYLQVAASLSAIALTLLFGLLEAVANRYQNIDLGGVVIPVQAMQALPYVLTVIILAGFVGKAIPPRAGGEVPSPDQRGLPEGPGQVCPGKEAPLVGDGRREDDLHARRAFAPRPPRCSAFTAPWSTCRWRMS